MSDLNNITLFCEVYCKFLGKITDDMYLELTYSDTLKILKSMLISAIVNFRFPKINIRDYYLAPCCLATCTSEAYDEIEEPTLSDTFADYCNCSEALQVEEDLDKLDHWNIQLGIDEIEILASLMKLDWLAQQLDTVEMLRMKALSSDFEMPSQANHIAKLTNWYQETHNQLVLLQNLYHRRTVDEQGLVSPNYQSLGGKKHGSKRQIRI